MNKSIIYLFLILCLLSISCNSQDVQTKLTIHNLSGKTLDSLEIYDLNEHKTYYDINPNAVITKKTITPLAKMPKGESGVFSINVFKDNYFYSQTAGFIGFPGTYLEDEYVLYIYDTFIANEKDFIPTKKDQRQNISEYIRGE